jgi:hypothetical protein
MQNDQRGWPCSRADVYTKRLFETPNKSAHLECLDENWRILRKCTWLRLGLVATFLHAVMNVRVA